MKTTGQTVSPQFAGFFITNLHKIFVNTYFKIYFLSIHIKYLQHTNTLIVFKPKPQQTPQRNDN